MIYTSSSQNRTDMNLYIQLNGFYPLLRITFIRDKNRRTYSFIHWAGVLLVGQFISPAIWRHRNSALSADLSTQYFIFSILLMPFFWNLFCNLYYLRLNFSFFGVIIIYFSFNIISFFIKNFIFICSSVLVCVWMNVSL